MPRSGLSPAQQAFALHARFPAGKCSLKAGRLLWRAELTPTPLSRSYRVEVSYRAGGLPRVRVLDELATREGRSLPHTYSDGTLCLHESHDWMEWMYIADSIVPWTVEWLAHYELWVGRATGTAEASGRRAGPPPCRARRPARLPRRPDRSWQRQRNGSPASGGDGLGALTSGLFV